MTNKRFFRNTLGAVVATLSLGIFTETTASADEGMWLPSLIAERIGDMQSKGFKLSAEDIYSVNQASLKDAVVLFGSGCTGEVISPEGLLLTNHHCGYGQIQRHSSVEHDYLRDGFWAMSREEELPNKGLTVSFLERMEDVTSRILEGCASGFSESQRDSVVKANSKRLIKEVTADGKGLKASVESIYYGNQYFLFLYLLGHTPSDDTQKRGLPNPPPDVPHTNIVLNHIGHPGLPPPPSDGFCQSSARPTLTICNESGNLLYS